MVFPFGKLQPDVRLFFEGRWQPIGDDVRLSTADSGGGISIERGRGDEHAEVDPGSMSLVLNNGVSQAFNNGGLQVTSEESASFASTPNSPDFAVSEIDLRADFTNELPEAGARALIGSEGGEFRLQTSSNRAWFFWTESDGTSTHLHVASNIPGAAIGRRVAIRVTLNPDIGNGQAQVIFYVGPTISGPWTMFDQEIEVNSSGGIAAPTGRMQVAGKSSLPDREFVGRVHAVMMMDSIDGRPLLAPEFNKQDAGTTEFTDRTSRHWTLNGSNVSIIEDRKSGVYSPRNPLSPLYDGDVGINTPIQVKVPKDIAHSFVLLQTDGDRIGAPFDSSYNVTDLDVRVDFRLLKIEPEIDQLIACHSDNSASDRAWALFTQPDATPGTSEWRSRRKRFNFFWSEDGSTFMNCWSFAFDYEELWNRRITVRVTLETDVGGQHRITFYTGESVDGPWTHQGEWNLAGTTSIHASSQPLMIGATSDGGTIFNTVKTMRGRVYAMQLRDGVDGPLVANPIFTHLEHDHPLSQGVQDGFQPSPSAAWAFAGSTVEIREPSVRFTGEVSEWPVRWDESDSDVWVELDAAGVLRRMSASAPKPIASALFTAISNDVSPEPDHYWPMEDKENSTIARPVFGEFPMNSSAGGVSRPDGRIAFAGIDATVGGSAPLPNFSEGNGVLRGRLNVGVDAQDSWAIGMLVSVFTSESDGDTAWGDAISIQTSPEASGNYDTIAIHFLYEDDLGAGSGGIQVTGETDPFGVHILVDTNVDITDGRWAWVEVIAFVDAGNEVFYEVFLNGESIGFGSPPGGSSIETTGQPREVVVRTNFKQGEIALGHMVFRAGGAVSGVSPFFNQISDAVGGHAGEPAGRRVERLANLLGINFRSVGDLDNTLPVGPQLVDSFLANARFAEKADPGSVIVEDPERVGLVFITAESQLNQEGLSLDYELGRIVAPFIPVDDDQRIINDFTAKRTGGSSARIIQETGRNNVQEPGSEIGARGEYASEDEYNVSSDLWLEDIAGWEIHRGTEDRPRYPNLNMNFARTRNVEPVWPPHVIADALVLDTGSLIRITNTPDWLPPEDTLALGQGYNEFIDAYEWTQGWNAIPGGPNEVAVLGDHERGRRDSTRSILADAVSKEVFGLVLPGESGSYASTPDAASLDITGDIDIRVEFSPNSITPDNGGDGYMLVAKYDDSTDDRSYRLSLNENGSLRLQWSTDGTAGTLNSHESDVPIPMFERLAVRVTLDVDDGGNNTATFYVSDSIDGDWVQLGTVQTDTGTTSLFSSSAELEVGARDGGTQFPFAGVIYAAEVRDGIGGTVVANPNFAAQDADTTSFDDDQGLTWTVHGDARIGKTNPKMFPVSVLLGPQWTTDEDDFPIYMMWRGERVSVQDIGDPLTASFLSVSQAASNAAVASFQVPVPDGVRKGTVILLFHAADVGSVSDMSLEVGTTDWQIRRIASIEPRRTCWMLVVGDDTHDNITVTQNSGADGVAIAVALNNAGLSIPEQLFEGGEGTNADGNGNYAMGVRSISGSGTAFSAPRSGPIRPAIEIRMMANEGAGVGNGWTAPSGYTKIADIESRGFVSATVAYQLVNGGETGFGTSDQFTSDNPGSARSGITIAAMDSNQSFTVDRGQNGILKGHSFEELGEMFRPSIRALQEKEL